MPPTQKLIKEILAYAQKRHFDVRKIKKAYKRASDLHKGQKRKSGGDFINHPLQVALYCCNYDADEETIISAILHDTVEDTSYTLEQVESDFGKDVRQLIDGLTKFSKNRFREAKTLDSKIESLRKWFQIMSKDIRVAVIKLFDRLHNVETLKGHNNFEKERAVAKETLEVFIKIADKLCLNELKQKLENTCLAYIDPKSFKKIEKIIQYKNKKWTQIIDDISSTFFECDTKNVIKNTNRERISLMHMYHEKVHNKDDVDHVWPLKVSITTNNIEDCYQALYLIHSIWPVENNTVQDFINNPQDNGYKGLHTTIIYQEGIHIEFHIRTQEMNNYYQKGICTFCFKNTSKSHSKNLPWFKQIHHVIEGEKANSHKFWQLLQHDILEESIVVYTDKDETLILPINSTALDAAYYSYGAKANHVKIIHVNGYQCEQTKELHNNDVISCNFSRENRVEHSWLRNVNTALARSYIKKSLQKADTKKKLILGKKLIEKELFLGEKGFIEEVDGSIIAKILKEYSLTDINQLYIQVAEGVIYPIQIRQKIQKKPPLSIIKSKYLSITGSLKSITKCLEALHTLNIKTVRYNTKSKNKESILTIRVSKIKISQWEELIKMICCIQGITSIQEKDPIIIYKAAIYITLINVLWGFEPIISKELFLTNISPLSLTLIRSSTIAIIWFFISFVREYIRQDFQKRKLPFFRWEILAISLLIFTTGFSFFKSIEGIGSSDFLLLIRFGIALYLASVILKKGTKNGLAVIGNIVICIGFILTFIIDSLQWSTETMLWVAIMIVSFLSILYFISVISKNLKVFSRFYRLQYLISIYCIFFSIIALSFFNIQKLDQIELFIGVIYSIIFGITPFFLLFQLMKLLNNSIKLSYILGGTFFIALCAEMILYNMYPSFTKIITTLGVYIGIFHLAQIYQKSISPESLLISNKDISTP
jgi:GTP pyrophosphokinase